MLLLFFALYLPAFYLFFFFIFFCFNIFCQLEKIFLTEFLIFYFCRSNFISPKAYDVLYVCNCNPYSKESKTRRYYYIFGSLLCSLTHSMTPTYQIFYYSSLYVYFLLFSISLSFSFFI